MYLIANLDFTFRKSSLHTCMVLHFPVAQARDPTLPDLSANSGHRDRVQPATGPSLLYRNTTKCWVFLVLSPHLDIQQLGNLWYLKLQKKKKKSANNNKKTNRLIEYVVGMGNRIRDDTQIQMPFPSCGKKQSTVIFPTA